jgi:hypothetical protein
LIAELIEALQRIAIVLIEARQLGGQGQRN